MTKLEDLEARIQKLAEGGSPDPFRTFIMEIIHESRILVEKEFSRNIPAFVLHISMETQEYRRFIVDVLDLRPETSSNIANSAKTRDGVTYIVVGLYHLLPELDRGGVQNFVTRLSNVLIHELIHLANPSLAEFQIKPINASITDRYLETKVH